MTVETTVMQTEPRDTGLKAIIYNQSAFPARALTDGEVPLLLPRRRRAAPVVVTPGYTQGCPSPSTARQVSGDLWYVEVDCTGHTIAPAGQSQHRMEVQFKVGVPEGGTWDPTNDPSYSDRRRAQPQRAALRRRRRIWGIEPGASTPDTTAPTAPGTPDRVGGHRDRRDPELGGVDRQRGSGHRVRRLPRGRRHRRPRRLAHRAPRSR